MGSTAAYTYDPWHHEGYARVLVKEAAGTKYMEIGRVMNPSFSPDYTTREKRHPIDGIQEVLRTKITGRSASLSFEALERMHPNLMQLWFEDATSVGTYATMDVKSDFYNTLAMQNELKSAYVTAYMPHKDSVANYTRLPKFATFTATPSAAGTGSGWATAGNPDYYAWAVPVHLRSDYTGSAPTTSTICDADKLDADWIFGAPWDEDTSTAGYQGETVNFTNATDDVTFTGTAPASGPTPDYVAIFMRTSNDITSSTTCVAVGTYAAFTGSGIVVLTLGAGDAYTTSYGASFYRGAGTYASPSWAKLTVDTDVTYDSTTGAWKLMSGDYNGLQMQIRCFYVQDYSITNTIGPTGSQEDYREVLIISEHPTVDGDGNPAYSEGQTLHVFKANFAGIASQWSVGEDDWVAPIPITVPCVVDPANGNDFAEVISVSRAYRSSYAIGPFNK